MIKEGQAPFEVLGKTLNVRESDIPYLQNIPTSKDAAIHMHRLVGEVDGFVWTKPIMGNRVRGVINRFNQAGFEQGLFIGYNHERTDTIYIAQKSPNATQEVGIVQTSPTEDKSSVAIMPVYRVVRLRPVLAPEDREIQLSIAKVSEDKDISFETEEERLKYAEGRKILNVVVDGLTKHTRLFLDTIHGKLGPEFMALHRTTNSGRVRLYEPQELAEIALEALDLLTLRSRAGLTEIELNLYNKIGEFRTRKNKSNIGNLKTYLRAELMKTADFYD